MLFWPSNGKWFLIFGCICLRLSYIISVYKEELYNDLISTLDQLSHNYTIIILGMTKSFIKPSFFQLLHRNGFNYIMLPTSSINYIENVVNNEVGLFIVKKSAL